MNERLELALKALLEELVEMDEVEPDYRYTTDEDEGTFAEAQVVTFADAGLLTSDRGIVMRMADGSEYQITIVRSK